MENVITIGQEPKHNLSGEVFSIMNEGYSDGHYTDALNVYCVITVDDKNILTDAELHLDVFEFAPFLNSSEFCLVVDDDKQNEFCSGSKTYKNSSLICKDGKKWTLEMEKRGSPNHELPVRFWMMITG